MARWPAVGDRSPDDSADRRALDPAADPGVLATLLARVPGLQWTADSTLHYCFVGGAAAPSWGVSAGGAVVDSLLAGTDGAGVAAHRAALAGEATRYEVRVAGAVLSCLVEPVRDGAARVIGVLGSGTDVSEQRRTTEALTTQHQMLESLFEHSIAGIAICDAQGCLLFANDAIRRFALGQGTDAPLEDQTAIWGEWYAAGNRLAVDAWPLARALRGETVSAYEIYRDSRDGVRHHILVGAAPVHDASGTLIGAVVTGADISAQKRMEAETRALNETLEQRVRDRNLDLRRVEQTLFDFLDHTTAVIYMKDRDSRYLLINRYFEELFDLKQSQVLGLGNADLFPPEVAAELRRNDLQVLTTGESLQVEEHVPTNGQPRIYLSVKFPLRDRDGAIYGLCGVSTDITDRKRIEAELRRSQATLAAVIESSPDPIWAVDAQLHLLAFNAAAARLIESVIGRQMSPTAALRHLVPADVLARWFSYLERGLAGERFTVEESLTIAGPPRRLLVSLTPTIEDGRVTGVAAFSKDITELMHAEEMTRQHQAELAHVLRLHTMGELTASLAHEVNQPLGAIANYAQGIRRRIDGGGIEAGDLRYGVEAIAREALRAGEITRRVRELLCKEEARRAATDVNAVVATALGVAGPTARQRDVRLIANLALRLPTVLADAIQIEQVVLNLVLNGIEAIAEPSARRDIELVTAAAGEHAVQVTVCDSGRGIAPELAGRIFDPFLTTKDGGLGMGLAISRSIIDAHGGRLWVEPAPAGGTVFHFVLPTTPGGAQSD
ncbi:MAG: PAS domain-containing sensor histidine kinase [Candidatus Binatia bacterium]